MLGQRGGHASLHGLRGDRQAALLEVGQLLLSLGNAADHDVPFQGGVSSGWAW